MNNEVLSEPKPPPRGPVRGQVQCTVDDTCFAARAVGNALDKSEGGVGLSDEI